MDLELSDEQRWLSEAVETLLARDGGSERLWASLVEFGALSVGGEDGLGAVELCLIARPLPASRASSVSTASPSHCCSSLSSRSMTATPSAGRGRGRR